MKAKDVTPNMQVTSLNGLTGRFTPYITINETTVFDPTRQSPRL